MSAHAFVSYSQPDRDCAFELVAHLEANGIDTWIAPRDISPSAEWAAEIIDAIGSAWIMVLVFSSHSNASPQVHREVERAVHKQVPVLPFRIEDVMPGKCLEYFLGAQHWLDAFPPPREPHYQALCSHLTAQRARALAGTGESGELGSAQPARAGAFNPTQTWVSAFNPTHTLPPGALSRIAPAWAGVAELAALERDLAYHMGPVARVLVRRAVGRARDREELILALACEIASEPARRQFIAACRAQATR